MPRITRAAAAADAVAMAAPAPEALAAGAAGEEESGPDAIEKGQEKGSGRIPEAFNASLASRLVTDVLALTTALDVDERLLMHLAPERCHLPCMLSEKPTERPHHAGAVAEERITSLKTRPAGQRCSRARRHQG